MKIRIINSNFLRNKKLYQFIDENMRMTVFKKF